MERDRPIGRHERKMWKLRYEPRMYEYQPLPVPAVKPETPAEAKPSIGALLFLAFLELLNGLSNAEGSGIEGEGK